MVTGDEVTLRVVDDEAGKSSRIDLPVVDSETEKTSANIYPLILFYCGVGAIVSTFEDPEFVFFLHRPAGSSRRLQVHVKLDLVS